MPAAAGRKTNVDVDDEINHPKGINLDTSPGGAAVVVPDKPADAKRLPAFKAGKGQPDRRPMPSHHLMG